MQTGSVPPGSPQADAVNHYGNKKVQADGILTKIKLVVYNS